MNRITGYQVVDEAADLWSAIYSTYELALNDYQNDVSYSWSISNTHIIEVFCGLEDLVNEI